MIAKPFKSVAGALLFSVILGPIGLLYASVWGGIVMVSLSIFVVCNHFYFLAFVCWTISCIWSVAAVEKYNQNIANLA